MGIIVTGIAGVVLYVVGVITYKSLSEDKQQHIMDKLNNLD